MNFPTDNSLIFTLGGKTWMRPDTSSPWQVVSFNVNTQLRVDLAAKWLAADPVLAAGELAYESDTGYLRIGNGSTPYIELPGYLLGIAGQQLSYAGTFI